MTFQLTTYYDCFAVLLCFFFLKVLHVPPFICRLQCDRFGLRPNWLRKDAFHGHLFQWVDTAGIGGNHSSSYPWNLPTDLRDAELRLQRQGSNVVQLFRLTEAIYVGFVHRKPFELVLLALCSRNLFFALISLIVLSVSCCFHQNRFCEARLRDLYWNLVVSLPYIPILDLCDMKWKTLAYCNTAIKMFKSSFICRPGQTLTQVGSDFLIIVLYWKGLSWTTTSVFSYLRRRISSKTLTVGCFRWALQGATIRPALSSGEFCLNLSCSIHLGLSLTCINTCEEGETPGFKLITVYRFIQTLYFTPKKY